MRTLEEIKAWNERVGSVSSPKDLEEVILNLASTIKDGSFPYENNNLHYFLIGLASAVYSFEVSKESADTWRSLAKVILRACVE